VVIERHLPQRVGESDLYRFDLRQLEWDWRDWHVVLSRYPYSPDRKLPLVVRADWLTVELTDAFASDSYYRLLYGGRNIPAARDDFLRFWRVEADPAFRFGLIEGRSGVALAGIRWIENRPTANRGYAWGTRDSARIDAGPIRWSGPTAAFATRRKSGSSAFPSGRRPARAERCRRTSWPTPRECGKTGPRPTSSPTRPAFAESRRFAPAGAACNVTRPGSTGRRKTSCAA
jgi:hypothetical protein